MTTSNSAEPAWRRLTGLVDAPARHAFLLARRPLTVSLAVIAAGLAVVFGVTFAANALAAPGADSSSTALMQDALRALAFVVPSAAIFGAYARLSLSPRAWLGALAAAFITAAIVLLATTPLLVYLALVSRAAPWFMPQLLLSAVALVAVGATLGRILEAADPGPKGQWAARLVGVALGAAFVAQVATEPFMQDILRAI